MLPLDSTGSTRLHTPHAGSLTTPVSRHDRVRRLQRSRSFRSAEHRSSPHAECHTVIQRWCAVQTKLKTGFPVPQAPWPDLMVMCHFVHQQWVVEQVEQNGSTPTR